MTTKIKIMLSIIAVLSFAIGTLWYPYRTTGIPEWKLQVIDVSGMPLAHVTTPDDVARAAVACIVNLTSSTGIVVPVDEGRHL